MPQFFLNLKNTFLTLRLSLNAKEGFTLIEVLIAIAITALAGVIALPGLRSFANRQQLNNTFYQLQTAASFTRSNAQNKTICSDVANAGSASTGWVLYFDDSTHFSSRALCPTLVPQTTYTITDSTYTVSSTLSPNSPCGPNTYLNFNNATGKVDLYCGNILLPDNAKLQLLIKLNSNPAVTKTILLNHGGIPSEQ